MACCSGFEMTAHWYFRRIRKLLSDLSQSAVRALPGNRRIINAFMTSSRLMFIEDLLSGLDNIEDPDGVAWDSNMPFSQYRDYLTDIENRMETTLRELEYFIEDEDTLRLVVGSGRPEKVRYILAPFVSSAALMVISSFFPCCSSFYDGVMTSSLERGPRYLMNESSTSSCSRFQSFNIELLVVLPCSKVRSHHSRELPIIRPSAHTSHEASCAEDTEDPHRREIA